MRSNRPCTDISDSVSARNSSLDGGDGQSEGHAVALWAWDIVVDNWWVRSGLYALA
jgi:hypothetical protein